MKQAVIITGGKQYLVSEGDVITVEKLVGETGDKVSFDKVALVFDDKDTKLGMPLVDGATVEAEVVQAGKADKVTIFKMKSKKGYKVKRGHRQPVTQVKITKV